MSQIIVKYKTYMIPIRKKPLFNLLEPMAARQATPVDPMAEIANSLKVLADRMADICLNQEKIIHSAAGGVSDRNSKMNRMEERFQRVSEDVPTIPADAEQNRQQRAHQIQLWLGKLCEQVFSITFSMLEYEKLNDRKAKAFCCENMLANIINMIKKNNLTADQIFNIDKCLKEELIPYFLMKYPMSEEAEINLQFASKIIQADSVKENQNDLVFKSKILFDYHEDGNYNKQIMRFINYVIELPGSIVKDQNKNLFKLFCEDMEDFFKNVEQEQFTIRMNKYNFRNSGNQKEQDNLLVFQSLKALTFQQEKTKQKYRENVRAYTKKLIGRKISQNVRPFTEIQIQEGDLKLKNPSVMRIITKWCEQLMENFDTTRNILNKEHQFRMMDGSQRILKRKHLLMLSQLIQREKKKVDNFLKKVSINNSECQFDFGNQKVPNHMKKFSEEECKVGLFASSVISNYQTYLVGYVNTIIHALMTATKCYQEMVKAYEYKQDEYGQYIQKWMDGSINFEDLLNRAYSYRLASVSVSYVSFIPQLVSFRVGDILRCRCTSKQKQIIALYTQLQRLSRKDPSIMKIVRVKNRLQKGTKDILINILYKNTLLVEMQLAIATNRTKFIDFSNRYNHVLYELKRAEFGPISQMCNIWINNDIKADFYITQARVLNSRQPKPTQKSTHKCQGQPIRFPFRCSQCKYFYNDCQYFLEHIQCETADCKKKICSLCRAEKFGYNQLKKAFPQIPAIQILQMKPNQTFQEFRKRTSGQRVSGEFMEGDQSVGMLLDLKGEDMKPIYYKNVKYGRKNFIIQIKEGDNDQMKMLKQLINKEQIRAFKKEYLIFSSKKLRQMIKAAESESLNRFLTEHNFSTLMKKWYTKQKQSIVFMYGNLHDEDLKKIDLKFPYAKKTCFFHNDLSDFNLYMSRFHQSQIIDLGENKVEKLAIKDFETISKDCLKILYLNYNKLKQIEPSFVQRFKNIQQLELSNNNLLTLPSCFEDLKQLKIMNLSRNNFTQLPPQVPKLTNLKILNLYSSKNRKQKLTSLPSQFGNLIQLRKLNLNFNALSQLPQTFGNLQSLQILSAIQNGLQKLPRNFQDIKQLKILILADNKFKEFPPEIGKLTKLQILNLESSSTNDLPQKRLPDCYCDLVNMKMMDVSKNNITELPQRIGDMHMLQTLFIYDNKIKEIPRSIGKLKKLRLLYASNNLLQRLPDQICEVQNLQKLTIKENGNLQELPANFGKLKKLKCLIGNGNNITHLPASFSELQNLRELVLKDNRIKKISSTLKLHLMTRLELDFDQLDSESQKFLKSLKT